MEIEDRMHNAEQAQQVLDNPAFAAAFDAMKLEIIETWTNSPAKDPEGREKLWQLLKLLDKLQANLRTTIDTGKLAKLELSHKRSLAETAKSWVGIN